MFNSKQDPAIEAITPPADRRIQRTRQLLRDALFSLIKEQGYEQISIQDITERANLGRTTFYLHYQDKEELLKASLKTLMHGLQLEVEPDAEERCPYQVRCIRIFQHIAQQPQLYQALLKETSPVNVGNLMRNYFERLFHHHIQEEYDDILDLSGTDGEIIAAHAAGALFGLISWWLDHGVSPTAENMGTIYFQLMLKGSSFILPQMA